MHVHTQISRYYCTEKGDFREFSEPRVTELHPKPILAQMRWQKNEESWSLERFVLAVGYKHLNPLEGVVGWQAQGSVEGILVDFLNCISNILLWVVYVCVCAYVHIQGPEARVFLSFFPSSISEDWLGQWGPGTCLSTPVPISMRRLRDPHPNTGVAPWHPVFCVDPGDLNSRLHVHMTSILATEFNS